MASSTQFINFVCDLLAPLGEVKSRKMMGDYIIYLNEKCVLTVCDNIVYVKKLPSVAELMSEAETGHPYEGAKEAYILDLSDPKLVLKTVSTLWDNLPFPKKRK